MRYHNEYVISTEYIILAQNNTGTYKIRIFSENSITNLNHFK